MKKQDITLTSRVKSELLEMIELAEVGDKLPSYAELAKTIGCSLAPVRAAMELLGREGKVSLQRGRPATVSVWSRSFSDTVKRKGHLVSTVPVELAYRPLRTGEAEVEAALELEPGDWCLVCSRVRKSDGTPIAYQRAYINPKLFDASRFFVNHDLVQQSLSRVYRLHGLGVARVSAKLRVGYASATERRLLDLKGRAAVLRSTQLTIGKKGKRRVPLELMFATYTDDITFDVERVPQWNRFLE